MASLFHPSLRMPYGVRLIGPALTQPDGLLAPLGTYRLSGNGRSVPGLQTAFQNTVSSLGGQ